VRGREHPAVTDQGAVAYTLADTDDGIEARAEFEVASKV